MNTKHFFKTIIIFIVMIVLGLLALYMTDYFDKSNNTVVDPIENVDVAK